MGKYSPGKVKDWGAVVARKAKGEPIPQIAKSLGVTSQAVRMGLMRRDVDTSLQPQDPAEQTKTLPCGYCGTLFTFRVERTRERKFCKAACAGKSQKKFDLDAVKADRAAGLTWSAIAAKHGSSVTRVYAAAIKAGGAKVGRGRRPRRGSEGSGCGGDS
jgi:hypothetical protein